MCHAVRPGTRLATRCRRVGARGAQRHGSRAGRDERTLAKTAERSPRFRRIGPPVCLPWPSTRWQRRSARDHMRIGSGGTVANDGAFTHLAPVGRIAFNIVMTLLVVAVVLFFIYGVVTLAGRVSPRCAGQNDASGPGRPIGSGREPRGDQRHDCERECDEAVLVMVLGGIRGMTGKEVRQVRSRVGEVQDSDDASAIVTMMSPTVCRPDLDLGHGPRLYGEPPFGSSERGSR